jgi:hypothetical protein
MFTCEWGTLCSIPHGHSGQLEYTFVICTPIRGRLPNFERSRTAGSLLSLSLWFILPGATAMPAAEDETHEKYPAFRNSLVTLTLDQIKLDLLHVS